MRHRNDQSLARHPTLLSTWQPKFCTKFNRIDWNFNKITKYLYVDMSPEKAPCSFGLTPAVLGHPRSNQNWEWKIFNSGESIASPHPLWIAEKTKYHPNEPKPHPFRFLEFIVGANLSSQMRLSNVLQFRTKFLLTVTLSCWRIFSLDVLFGWAFRHRKVSTLVVCPAAYLSLTDYQL